MTTGKNNTSGPSEGEGQAAYGRAKELFLRLVDLPPDQRESFLAENCREDPVLERQVKKLLELHDSNIDGNFEGVPSAPPIPPQLGPYIPARLLGQGGTGAVYLAFHHEDQAPVALKVLLPGMLARESRLRFSREGDVLARMDHPGIARLLDVGEEETPHGPVYYLTTEYIDGLQMDQYLQAGEFSVEEKLRLVLGVCQAVAHAHREGVVHRDLKPANIMVTADGQPHILDFGVSRLLSSAAGDMTPVTETGQLLGTLKYMSPEQAEGTEIGSQTDVYALGLVLHEILTGQMPYEVPAHPIHLSLAAILTALPTWPSQIDSGLDSALDAITAQCLARLPENRYASASELAADLTAFLAGEPVAAPMPRPSVAKPPATGARFRWFPAASILAVLLGVLMWQPWRGDVTRTDEELRPILGKLDLADQELHFKEHALEGLNQAVAILDSAQVQLHELPSSNNKTALLRYASSRLGEAHYFLGSRLYSPAEFELALRSYDSANHPQFNPEELADLPVEAPVTTRARRRGRHHASLGQALVYTALAEHRRPRFNLEQAVFICNEARKIQEGQRGPNYWYHFDDAVRQGDRAIILNDYARSLTLLAAVCDSLPLVEQALPMFAEADTFTALRDNLSAYGSLLRGWAGGFLTRAQLTRSVADLDSTRNILDRCLGLGEVGIPARFRINLMLTEMALLKAEWGTASHRNYLKAREMSRNTRNVLEGREGSIAPNLKARLLQAEAAIALATAQGDVQLLAQSDSLLAEALAVLPPERYLPLRAGLLLDCGEVAFARFSITGDRAARQLARGFLDQGLPYADPALHPRLARLYAEARQRFDSVQEKN